MDEAGKRHGTSRFTVMMILGLILWGLFVVCRQRWSWIDHEVFNRFCCEASGGRMWREVFQYEEITWLVGDVLSALVFLSAAHVMRIKGAGAGLFMAGALYLYYRLFFALRLWTECDAPVVEYLGRTCGVVGALVPFLIPRQVLRNAWLVAMKWVWFVCLVGHVVYGGHPVFWGRGVPGVVWVCSEWIVYLAFWTLLAIDVMKKGTDFREACVYSFEGRMGRRQFWPLYVGILVPACVLAASFLFRARDGGFVGTVDEKISEEGRYWLGQIFAYLATFFSMPLRVRRLHDRGMSGKWLVLFDIGLIAVMVFVLCGVAGIGQTASSVFLVVASVIGFGAKFVEFIFLCLKGTEGENRYGPNPSLPLNSSHVIAPPTA